MRLTEEKDGLEVQNRKLAEEASYAKELASAAAIELRNLAEEVTKLSYENAKLTGDMANAKESRCQSACCQSPTLYNNFKQNTLNRVRTDGRPKKLEDELTELQKELNFRLQKESVLEKSLSEREKIEDGLRRRLDEAKKHGEHLETELASMWVLVAKLRKSSNNPEDVSPEAVHSADSSRLRMKNGYLPSNGHYDAFKDEEVHKETDMSGVLEGLKASYQKEKKRCQELESYIARLKVCLFLY